MPSLRRSNHFASLQFGPADFPASNILCSPDNRLCRVCGAAITLRPCNSALRTFRRRTSYAPLTTGCAEFSAQQSLLRPCNSALRTFRRRTSYAPLTTGSAEFSAQQSLCAPAIRPCGLSGVEHLMLPDNRLCRVFGAAITLRPCNSALRTFRRRTSYAPLTTGSAEFSAQQSLCAPAIRPCGLSGVEHLMLP